MSCPSKMANISNYAYLDADEAKPRFKSMGYPYHRFYDRKGAQCHIVWNKEEFIIAFRGTEPKEHSDIIADLNIFPDHEKCDGLESVYTYVHDGFQNELDKLWPDIEKSVAKIKKQKLYITGHSLGAAMATIAASRLKSKVETLYTFGSPRVGNRNFVDNLDVQHYRFVNNNDVVPSAPWALLGYRHHGTLVYINYHGNIVPMTTWRRVKDKIRGRFRALQKMQFFDGFYDHSIKEYCKNLKEE